MEAYPSYFPQPTPDYSVKPEPSMLGTTMDSGTVRQRLRFTVEKSVVNLTWSFPDETFAAFCGWHKHYLNFGEAWFTIDLPTAGGGIKEHEARFVLGVYSHDYEPVGRWRVRATLEIKERQIVDASTTFALLDTAQDPEAMQALIDVIEDVHEYMHDGDLYNDLT